MIFVKNGCVFSVMSTGRCKRIEVTSGGCNKHVFSKFTIVSVSHIRKLKCDFMCKL